MAEQEFVLGNVYEMSKNIVGQFKPLNALEIATGQQRIEKWLENNLETMGRHYWMLLCKERSDYTVFVSTPTCNGYDFGAIAQEIIGCMIDRGTLLDICLDDHETAYELWVNTPDDSEVHMYLLFPYDKGIIER